MNDNIISILNESSIFTLREFGAFIGVPNSSALKKEALITAIATFLDSPVEAEGNKKGRKHMTGLSGLMSRLALFPEFRPFSGDFAEYANLEIQAKSLAENYKSNVAKQSQELAEETTPILSEDKTAIAEQKQLECEGHLEIIANKGFGFIRTTDFDVFISEALIKKMCLKAGDYVRALYSERQPGKYAAFYIKSINKGTIDDSFKRVQFENLQASFPTEKLKLVSSDLAIRAIDLFAPIGKGQRGLIVSPPKAGKTTIIKNLAKAIKAGNPDMNIFILLIDERPEEVTDMKIAECGEVVFSAFDDRPDHHTKVATGLLERAKRLVESGSDVCILMDSLTRFARAVNMGTTGNGRSLSGGIDASALQTVKNFFGSGRNTLDGGSLTLIATALVDTNSKMDDLVFEEFKGTGNMELMLDRNLSEKRIFPSINIEKSGTRRDELLFSDSDYKSICELRKYLFSKQRNSMEVLIDLFAKIDNNEELLQKLPLWFKTLEQRKH